MLQNWQNLYLQTQNTGSQKVKPNWSDSRLVWGYTECKFMKDRARFKFLSIHHFFNWKPPNFIQQTLKLQKENGALAYYSTKLINWEQIKFKGDGQDKPDSIRKRLKSNLWRRTSLFIYLGFLRAEQECINQNSFLVLHINWSLNFFLIK